MVHRVESVDVNGSSMEVFIFEPQGAGPHPGLIQCIHIPVGHTGIENDTFSLQAANDMPITAMWWQCPSFFTGGQKRRIWKSRGMNFEMIGQLLI